MTAFKCPHCGNLLNLPGPKKTGLYWGIGCAIAVVCGMVLLSTVGMLAAIAIPSFVRARTLSQQNACINNLRMIDSAKDSAAVSAGIREGQPLSEQQVGQYFPKGLEKVVCPGGGKYTLNPVGQDAECSIHGTVSNPRRLFGPPHRLPPAAGP